MLAVSYTSLTTTLQLLQNFNVDCIIWGALKVCSVFQLDQKSWDLEMIRSKRLAWPSIKLFKSFINSSIKLFKWFSSKPVTWLCHPDYLPSFNQIAPGEYCLTSGRLASSMEKSFFSKANLLNFKGISKFTHLTPFNHLLLKIEKKIKFLALFLPTTGRRRKCPLPPSLWLQKCVRVPEREHSPNHLMV